jgi:hypothetical protein
MRYEQPNSSRPATLEGQTYTDQISFGRALAQKYHLRSVRDITSCSTCHR